MLAARPSKCVLLIKFAFTVVTRKYVVPGKLFHSMQILCMRILCEGE